MCNESIKIAFIGDIVLNHHYMEMSKRNQNPFIGIDEYLSNFDFVVGNLECFVKGLNGENHLKKPRLTTTTKALNYLNDFHLNVACLANNHAYDHLEGGFLKTKKFLNEQGIQSLGAGETIEKASTPIIIEKNSIKVGLLNYVTRDTNPNLPQDAKLALNFFDENKVIDEIIKLKSQVDQVVICMHWGGRVEGGMFPDYEQPKIAKKLINSGADLIIGHHSHTFQPFQIYKDKYIFYSLGNFCFSDYNFEGKYYDLPERSKITGIVNVNFNKTGYQVNLEFYKNQLTHFAYLNQYPILRLNFLLNKLLRFKTLWNLYYLNYKTLLPLALFLKRNDLSGFDKAKRIFKSVIFRYKRCS